MPYYHVDARPMTGCPSCKSIEIEQRTSRVYREDVRTFTADAITFRECRDCGWRHYTPDQAAAAELPITTQEHK